MAYGRIDDGRMPRPYVPHSKRGNIVPLHIGVGCLLAARAVVLAFGAAVPSGEDKIKVNLSAKIVFFFFAANEFALKMKYST